MAIGRAQISPDDGCAKQARSRRQRVVLRSDITRTFCSKFSAKVTYSKSPHIKRATTPLLRSPYSDAKIEDVALKFFFTRCGLARVHTTTTASSPSLRRSELCPSRQAKSSRPLRWNGSERPPIATGTGSGFALPALRVPAEAEQKRRPRLPSTPTPPPLPPPPPPSLQSPPSIPPADKAV